MYAVYRLIGNEKYNGDIPTALYYLSDYLDYRFTDILRKGYIYSDNRKAYFEIKNIETFETDCISILEYFEKLYSLFGTEYDVVVKKKDTIISCTDMSEGQRQLIKVLGMLGICKSEDCLILMDEPDAHMNPKWKYEIKNTMDTSIKNAINSQALIATHDPLVINGVDKEYIRIFMNESALNEKGERNEIRVIKPTESTEGMGIDGLLQSEYYGLKTSYDKKTTERFERRQTLYSKLINNEINIDEKEELRTLTKEIGFMPVSYNSIDFLYDDFIKVFKNSELYYKEYLSYDEVQKRRKEIEEIITALYEGQV